MLNFSSAISALLCLYLAAVLLGGCTPATSSRDEFNEGMRWWSGGNYKKAIDRFDQAIKMDKQPDPLYFRWRATSNQGLGQYRAAISDYTEALRLDKINTAKAGDYEGRACVQLTLANQLKGMEQLTRSKTSDSAGFYQKAIEDFSKSLELNQANATAYANRGTAYFKLGYLPLALNDYDRAISENPDHPLTYISRGRTLFLLQKYEQSLGNLTKGIETQLAVARTYHINSAKLRPFYANAYHFRAQAYDKLGKHALALKDEKLAKHFGFKNGG